jgi:ATP-dependent Lon protease
MAFSLAKPSSNTISTETVQTLPVIALREGVVFPHTEAHLTFGRPKSNSAIETALKGDKKVVLLAQKQPTANPLPEDLYEVGTLCEIEQVAPYGNELLALVRGVSRVRNPRKRSNSGFSQAINFRIQKRFQFRQIS